MSELVLSASSVASYQDCHYQWFLKYIERHAGEQNVPAATGQAVHAAAETWYKDALNPPPEWSMGSGDNEADYYEQAEPLLRLMAVDRALHAFDERFTFETMDMTDPGEDLTKARAVGRRVVNAYIEDVALYVVPVWVEKYLSISINGINYSMYLDLVDDEDRIRDLKVLKSKPRDPADKLFQLIGNALGFRAETGRIERDVMNDVMIRLKRDRPYYVPYRYGGPVSDRDIGRFAARLEGAAEGIAAHDYAPTGLEKGSCTYCGVKTLCSYYSAFRQIEKE